MYKRQLEFHGGVPTAWEDLLAQIQRNPLLKGVTLSGGEPFCQAEALLPLCRALREKGYELAAYTGYTLEQLWERQDEGTRRLLAVTDILVDGPYVEAERDLTCLLYTSRCV